MLLHNEVELICKEAIFIVHALKGYEYHEERIHKYFEKHKLNYEFVTDGDPSLVKEEQLRKYFSNDIKKYLSDGVLSCTLNHIYAYEKIVARNLPYAIVFENDPFFLADFRETLHKYISEIVDLPKGFIVSIENSALRFPSFWTTKKGKYLYQADSGRMAGAYIIDLEGAKKILTELETIKCDTVIDWWHNKLISRKTINMYWAHPPLIEQGSHNGLMSSTISSKSNSYYRRITWLAQKFYKYYIRRLFNERRVFP